MPTTTTTAPALLIAQHFATLDDPRVVGRTDHPLLTVVVIALAAVIGGCNGWDDIHEFGVDRRAWFASFLDLPQGIPSADTFRRVFTALRPAGFAACVQAWVQSLAAPLAGQVVAFDGKALRGALKRAPLGAALHLVHVWACQQRLLLAQTAVPGAPEEVPAVRDLLTLIDVRGALLTGDAAHCTRDTAQAILDAEAAWLLHLKANRSAAYATVTGFFTAARADGFAGVAVRHVKATETGHGRTEIREAWSIPAAACPLPGADWPGLGSLTLIERTRLVGLDLSRECHYYVSSLTPTVRRIAAAAREHWAVENGCHWILDVQMGEDACAVRDENAAQNLATLRRVALMLLRREDSLQRGVAAKQKKAARNTEYLERVLTRGINED